MIYITVMWNVTHYGSKSVSIKEFELLLALQGSTSESGICGFLKTVVAVSD